MQEGGPTYDARTYQRAKSERWPFILFILIILVIIAIVLVLTIKHSKNLSETELSEGKTLDLKENRDIKFKIGDTQHKFSVNLVGLDSADMTLQSEPIEFTMGINDVRKFDLDGDGNYDIRIKLVSIEDRKAFVAIIKIDEKVCKESWTCTLWSSCFNETQTRVCHDLNKCGTNENKPLITRDCLDNATVLEDNETKTNKTALNDSLQAYIDQVKAIDCSILVAPNCGVAYPDEVTVYNITSEDSFGTSTNSIPVFDEDCAMVCFGKAFRNNCQKASVILRDSEGTEQELEILGLDSEGQCKVNMTFGEVGPSDIDYVNYSGTYIMCPLPTDSDYLSEASCPWGSCLEENMPGQTTVGIMVDITLLLGFGVAEHYGCEGTSIDVFEDVWNFCFDESDCDLGYSCVENMCVEESIFYCGDGGCDSGEDCNSCEVDCGECIPFNCENCVNEGYGWCQLYNGTNFCDISSECWNMYGEAVSIIQNCPGYEGGEGNEGAPCEGDEDCEAEYYCDIFTSTCVINPVPNCGDGTCGDGETCENCGSDCGSCNPSTCESCISEGGRWCIDSNTPSDFCDTTPSGDACAYAQGTAISTDGSCP